MTLQALRAAARAGAALGVVVVLLAVALLVFAQQDKTSDSVWLELLRFLPYPWLLLPCLVGLGASVWLGRAWVAASVAGLVALLAFGMGLHWTPAREHPRSVRLMTYNIKAVQVMEKPGGLEALGLAVARHAPDLLVMQDAHGLIVERSERPVDDGPAVFGLRHVYAVGQYVVASRFPIAGCTAGQIGFESESHRYLRCQVDVEGKPLTLLTAHFQSPRAGLMAARHQGLGGRLGWQRNHERRMTQSHKLARDLAGVTGPLVLAGDLNAPPASPVLAALEAVGLRNAFSVAGRGYGYSYGHALRWGYDFLRIDHIYVSPDIDVINSFVAAGDASDHRPVVADLVLPQ